MDDRTFLFISVIVATYNRHEELEELLGSLAAQTYPKDRFEIVVVDDGSTDDTRGVVGHFTDVNGLPIRYFCQANQGPGPSRNLGMREARGEVFVFIDSDCIAPPDWLQHIAQAMANEDLDAFGGPDRSRADFAPLVKAIDYSMTSFIGTGGTRGSTELKVGRYYPRSFNMGFRRKVYEHIGDMGNLRHGQDLEFSNRMYREGFGIGFLPAAFVYHKRRTSLKQFFKQVFNWGVTRVNLGRIDKQMLKPVHRLPALVLVLYAFLTLGAVSSRRALWPWLGVSLLGVVLLVFAGVQSLIRYRSLQVAVLSVVTLTIQIVAYGSGFLFGMFGSVFSRSGEPVEGFTKDYYK